MARHLNGSVRFGSGDKDLEPVSKSFSDRWDAVNEFLKHNMDVQDYKDFMHDFPSLNEMSAKRQEIANAQANRDKAANPRIHTSELQWPSEEKREVRPEWECPYDDYQDLVNTQEDARGVGLQ